MKVDRKTGESILIEFGRSVPPRYSRPYSAGMDLLFEIFPWRSLLLGLFLFASLLTVLGPEGGLAALPVLATLIVVETLNRRDFATPLRIVSQFGILGKRRIEIPVEEIQRVEVSVYTSFGRELDLGAVTVVGDRVELRLSVIPAPAATAQHILDLKHRNEVRKEIAGGKKTGEAPSQTPTGADP